MKVATKALVRLAVAAAKAHVASGNFSGPIYQPYIGLYTAIANGPSPNSVMADLTPADYTGYARQQITAWTGPYDTQGFGSELVGPLMVFAPTDAVTPNVILGAFWADAPTAGSLLGLDPFDTPVALPDANASLLFVARYLQQFAADYGAGEVLV